MRKIFTFLMICAAMSMSAATVFNYSDSVEPQTADGFTARLDKGAGNNAPAAYDNNIRMYANNTITVVGTGITKVELTFTKQGSKAYATLTANAEGLVSGGESTGATDLKTDVWTGSTDSIVFTLGASGQRIIKRIVINRADGEELPGDSTDTEQPTDSTQQALDSTYVYSDTAFVVKPEMYVKGAAYSFVENNIQVSASKGAIDENYFSCHAGERMTFTATQAFKGIVIKGYIKKDFTATTDRGEIAYATTDADAGLTADPVIVITDIDSTSVTITCAKQLRCYEVRVFFAANPEDSIAGSQSGGGETFFVTYDSGSYDYWSAFSEEGSHNYMLYFWNAADENTYVGLDIFTTEELAFEGVYSLENGKMGEYSFYSFGPNEDDYYDVTDVAFAINKEANVYSVSGYFTCENGDTYNFTFSGALEEEPGEEGLEDTKDGVKATKVLRNGQLWIIRGEKTYNALGAEVK